MDSATDPNLNTEQKETIRDTIHNLLNDPSFIKLVSKDKVIKRPPTNSKLSNLSYFREQFAFEVKVVLDDMIKDKKDRVWRYSKYPELKRNSLYQRIYQSLRYLIIHLDPEGTYASARDCLLLHKTPVGVRLSWIRDKLLGKAFVPDIVDDNETLEVWKEQVTKFLEDETRKVLHLKNLMLTEEQQKDLSASFVGLEGVDHLITDTEIKIVKSYMYYTDQEPSA